MWPSDDKERVFWEPRLSGYKLRILPFPPSDLMLTSSQALALAIQHHKAGRLGEAEQLYDIVLRQKPDAADFLYLWGVLRGQQNDLPMAELLCRQASERDPRLRLFETELGEAIRNSGDFDRLLQLFAADVALRPGCLLLTRPGEQKADPHLRPHLAGVTLCCIDTFYHNYALIALKNCLAQCQFDEVLFLSDRDFCLPNINTVIIENLKTSADYSRFVMKDLHKYIQTPYVLIVQWDGFILDARRWTNEYLAYDYIGARWKSFNDEANVGNGGFSLRSRRLLQATADAEITQVHPEDVHLCRTYRPLLQQRYGISYAPQALADRFSVEWVASSAELSDPVLTFGFHSLYRMHRVLDPDQVRNFLDDIPPATLTSPSMILLGASFLHMGHPAQAHAIASRILELDPDHPHKAELTMLLAQAVG